MDILDKMKEECKNHESCWDCIFYALCDKSPEFWNMNDMDKIRKIFDELKRLKNPVYDWHDLRKNPNDLPEEDRTVMICFFSGVNQHIELRVLTRLRKGLILQ